MSDFPLVKWEVDGMTLRVDVIPPTGDIERHPPSCYYPLLVFGWRMLLRMRLVDLHVYMWILRREPKEGAGCHQGVVCAGVCAGRGRDEWAAWQDTQRQGNPQIMHRQISRRLTADRHAPTPRWPGAHRPGRVWKSCKSR